MADQPPAAGSPAKEKKDTVRITLPPRPMQSQHGAPASPSTATTARPAMPASGAPTVPAIPAVPGKKETSRLKKTTGKVPGATKPAMPVVPPPTIRAQPVAQPPSTVSAAPVPSPTAATTASPAIHGDSASNRPTVKLQTADIPKGPAKAPVSEASRSVQAPPATAAPAPASSGPTLVDALLGLAAVVVSGLVAFQLWQLTQ